MPEPSETGTGRSRAPALAAWVAAAVVTAFLAVLLLSDALDPVTTDLPAEDGLSAQQYRDVVLGIDPEALTERLLPVQPVDRVPPLSPQDESLPAAQTRCLYYEASGSTALYRFCFTDDRLIDKRVVLPPEQGGQSLRWSRTTSASPATPSRW